MTTPSQDDDQPIVAPWRPSPFPPSGPPPSPPAQKSRVGLIAAVTAVLLALIAGTKALVLALRPTMLDRSAVERDVAAQFADLEGVTVDLSCPAEMDVTAGATYDCRGITADGEEVTLRIAITDEESATYTWAEL
jgi:hypothetical protein